MSRSAVLVLVVLLCAAPFLSAQRVEGSFDRTLKVSGAVQLHVSTGAGGITVRRGAGDAVRVQGHIRANTNWFGVSGDPAARVKEIEQNPPIRQTGNIITIGNEVQRWDNVGISYDLTVPEQTQVTAQTGSGSIEVSDVRGPADLRTGSGSIRAESIGGGGAARAGGERRAGPAMGYNAGGAVQARTGSGTITVMGAGGDVNATTGSGGITISQVGGRVRADASSGGVTVQKALADVDAHSGSGTITIDGRPSSARWEARTGSGGIHVSLPQGTGFELDASTSSGSVSTSHSITTTGTIGRKSLRGTVGKPDNHLLLHTSSGSIRID